MKNVLVYQFLSFFFFYSSIAWGQTDHTDSILSAISGLSPSEQADTLNALSVFYAGNSQYYQA
ncbi:MAG: hypothetical protein ABIJ04_00310, partial [Bacteroidota bacterium]